MLCPHFALVIANPPPSRRILEQAIQWQGQHFADTHPHLVEDQHHRLHLLVKLTQMIEELIQDVVRNVARRPLRLGWKIVFKNDCFSRERRPPLTGRDIRMMRRFRIARFLEPVVSPFRVKNGKYSSISARLTSLARRCGCSFSRKSENNENAHSMCRQLPSEKDVRRYFRNIFANWRNQG